MLPDDRFSRQRRVPEVGNAGQALLCRTTVTLPESDSSAGSSVSDVAEIYLLRAGMGVERCTLSPLLPFQHAHAFAHGSARELAEGAHLALVAMRRTLELDADATQPVRGERAVRERVLFP